jgi:quercetin dioxygenase-like cupin family protein
MRRCVRAAVLGVCSVWLVAAAAAQDSVVWSASDLKWVDSPTMKGAKTAVLWGDPAKGAFGALNKIPAGMELPNHWHSADRKVVTVSGAIALSVKGAPAKDMGAGAFASLPAKVPHSATCKKGADCVYFEESAGKADMVLVEGAKK